MHESWTVDHDGPGTPVPAGTVTQTLRTRIAEGRLETWLTSSAGRSLALVTNTRRAMVMVLDGEDDPGEHAATPGAEGWSEGFVLTGGQHDAYPDADTVPLSEALRIASHIVRTGNWPSDATWVTDR
ncbi:hypothetical protein ACW4TU_45400 (plasmid) [Streptomyces sp. QTS52]